MNATATTGAPRLSVWGDRLRTWLAIALVWALLAYVGGPYVAPRGLERPVVLVGAHSGPLTGVLVVVLLWIGGAAATLLAGARDARRPLMAVGAALALWAFRGQEVGTMDDWLIARNSEPGPPASGPYWLLLVDYLYLSIGVLGVAVIGALLAPARPPGHTPMQTLRETFGLDIPAPERARGLAGLLIATAVATLGTVFLMGPAASNTRHGQVWFAVGVGFALGVFVAVQVVKTTRICWYWPGPLLLGILSVVVAAVRPAFLLPAAYDQLDIIPAWGPARALPVEMVGVGLVAALWFLKPDTSGAKAEPSA